MTPSFLFETGNSLALLSWILLLIFSHKKWATQIVFSFSILLLSITYAYLIGQGLGGMDMESFSTLANVKALFTSDMAVAAGWMHYLAFDLMVGLYIVSNARKNGVNRFIIIPALLLTFMFGPVGLLVYLLIRTIAVKKWAFYDD